MAGNIIKGGYTVVNNKSNYIIDSNETVKRKLEELREQMANATAEELDSDGDGQVDGFVEGLDPLFVERLVSDDEDMATGERILGESEDMSENQDMPLFSEETSSDNPSDNFSEGLNIADNIVSQEEIDAIYEQAKVDAEAIKADAQASGFEEGHAEGYAKGQADGLQDYENRLASIEAEYNQKVQAIQNEYEELKAGLETAIVDKLCDIYEHVINVNVSDNKELILSLISKAMSEQDGGRNYVIHVSREDIEDVVSHKEDILSGCGISPELVDIIEDNSVMANGCLVESELGIFDCGLGTQLSLLKKQLKLLSVE